MLSVHVLAAILAIGPVAVAASMFPRLSRERAAGGAGGRGAGLPRFLHRIYRVYMIVGIAVPAFGAATAAQLGVLGDAWLIVSMILTAVAAAILTLVILPGQRRLLTVVSATVTGAESAAAEVRSAAARLAALTGVFNLIWAVVVVLMIVRPGSTTGV